MTGDKTLTPERLKELADQEGVIENFDEDSASGASYDFRAGDKVVVARPSEDEHKTECLQDQGSIRIKPGHSYTIYSKERINLPDDIQGRLSLKFRLASKKLFYSGGVIDPGYEGYLFFTIFNLSSSDYTIEYEDRIVAGDFKRIERTTKPYDREKMDNLPDEMLPAHPSANWRVRNREQINSLLSTHESKVKELEEETENLANQITRTEDRVEGRMSDIDNRMDALIRTGIASALAGIFAGLTIQIWSTIL